MKSTISQSVAVLSLIALAAGSLALAQGPKTPSPKGAKVYFIQPKDGQTVKGQVHVVMGLAGVPPSPLTARRSPPGSPLRAGRPDAPTAR